MSTLQVYLLTYDRGCELWLKSTVHGAMDLWIINCNYPEVHGWDDILSAGAYVVWG